MKINDCYSSHINVFIKYKGERDLNEKLLHEYAQFLFKKYKPGTACVRWYAVQNYLKNNSDWNIEKIVKETAWIQYLYIEGKDRDGLKTYIVSDFEFEKMLSIASQRDALLMEAIRYTGLRVSQVLNIKVSDDILSSELKKRCIELYKGDKYLFVTSGIDSQGNKRRISREYISKRIKEYGKEALGKRVSAESLRRAG